MKTDRAIHVPMNDDYYDDVEEDIWFGDASLTTFGEQAARCVVGEEMQRSCCASKTSNLQAVNRCVDTAAAARPAPRCCLAPRENPPR